MSTIEKDIEKYHLRKKDIENFHLRILVELHPSGADNPHPDYKKYKPTGVLSRRDWEGIKKSYRLLFASLHVKIEMIEKYLDDFYGNWKNGVYPTSEKFLETLDEIFREFADLLQTKNQKFYTDIETYDNLLEKFEKITSKMKHISPGDEEIGQKILREQATELQEQIERYFKQRAKHGHELTDEMLAFKGLQTILDDLHFETVLKPQLPTYEPPEPEYNIPPEPKSESPQGTLPDDYPPIGEVDRESYDNHTLYILAEDMDAEFQKKKGTEEFQCFEGKRIRFFNWCSHKYTYQGGKTFTGKGMEGSLNSSRTRSKAKKVQELL